MVDVCVRVGEPPTGVIRIGRKIRLHVFVDFLLKVNPHGAINADDFVGAHSGVGRNIAVGVRNANIRGIVANNVLRALDSGRDNPLYEGGWTVRCLREVESNEKCDRNVASYRSKRRRAPTPILLTPSGWFPRDKESSVRAIDKSRFP